MLTLNDVQTDVGMAQVLPYNPTSPQFIDKVNSATRMLMRRGDWWETAIPIFVCVFNGCVVWPRYVGQVRRINLCGWQIPVHNLWYQFMVGIGGHGCGDWSSRSGRHGWWGREVGMRQEGQSPVLQDIMGEGRLVRLYTRCNSDYGLTTTIYGTDNNGQPLMTENPDHTWSQGIVLTAQAPFASSSVFVRHIDRVVRQQSQCIQDLYAYNATTNLLEELAHYEPSETEPSYSKTRLQMPWPWLPQTLPGTTCCSANRGVLALVKLKFIPAQVPSDLVLIPNIDALKDMVVSILSKEKGDLSKSQQFELSAVRELNRELEDNSDDSSFSAIDNTFGGSVFSNNCF